MARTRRNRSEHRAASVSPFQFRDRTANNWIFQSVSSNSKTRDMRTATRNRDRKRAESPDMSRDSDNNGSSFRPRFLHKRLRNRILYTYIPQLHDAFLMDKEARSLDPARGGDVQNFVLAIMKDDIYKAFYNTHGTGMDLPSHEYEVSDR